MNRIVTFLGLRRSKTQNENVRSSIGERRGSVQKGKYTCWEAVGLVREDWGRLGPEIKDYVETSCKYGPALSLEIYMIGRTEEKAVPTILICSEDLATRKDVQRAIRRSGIMKKYPAIGLGNTATLPDLLASEDIELSFPSSSTQHDDGTAVLSSPFDQAFGRRFFIPRHEGGLLRPSTAGPILYINDRTYQLTVGHAFWESREVALSKARASDWDDCEFDGQSDSEVDVPYLKSQFEDEGDSISKTTPLQSNNDRTDNESCTKAYKPYFQTPESSSTAASQHLIASPLKLSRQDQNQTGDLVIPKRLVRVGKLALESKTGDKLSLDYALVELERGYRDGNNELGYAPNASQRWLRVRQTAKIGTGNVKVVTRTGSSGILKGELCYTASYKRLPNDRTLQELYPVNLVGKLADGDCGAAIVDQFTGDLYGHIVAGTAGTSFAYIVPAVQVFQDILVRLGGDVTLVRPEPEKPTTSKDRKDRTSQEPLRITEFASKEYFRQLKQSTQSVEEQSSNKSLPSAPLPTISYCLPIGLQMPKIRGNRRLSHRSVETQIGNRQTSPRHLDPVPSFRRKALNVQIKISRSGLGQKGKGREVGYLSNCLSLEDRFFALPSDIHVQIIASLLIPDILNLRLTSTAWHNLILVNEAPIARAFMEQNHIPYFAIHLYPVPNPSQITLNYLFGLWHRFSVASKLSAIMTECITEDMFLRKSDAEQLEFIPYQIRMCRRLIPLLFIIFHFFETYRQLHLKRILEHGHDLPREGHTINSIEVEIMRMYDNKMLLQAHQVFPHLISAFERKLRPPSYFSRIERSLRGYHKGPASTHVQAAVFCIGGLREVARLLDIRNHEARREAVDNWYISILGETPSPGLQPRHRLSLFEKWHLSLASSDRVKNGADKMAAAAPGASLHSILGHRKEKSNTGTVVFEEPSGASPPMGPLPAEIAQMLIPHLPMLNEIWILTAESLLLTRCAVERKQDIKRDEQVMQELIWEGNTMADNFFI